MHRKYKLKTLYSVNDVLTGLDRSRLSDTLVVPFFSLRYGAEVTAVLHRLDLKVEFRHDTDPTPENFSLAVMDILLDE